MLKEKTHTKCLHTNPLWFRQEDVDATEFNLASYFGYKHFLFAPLHPGNRLPSGIPIFKKDVTPLRYELVGTNLYLFQVDPEMLYLKTKHPQENMVVVQCRKLYPRHTRIIDEIKKMVCQRIGVTYMPLLVRYTEIKEVSTNS